ncbi:MAG TPA: alanine racemase [Flavobacteriaceae bacterium]|nr:alanine racemase [Flavobacteriaceae bacterium]
MSNITETVLEIDLNSLAHNYYYLRSKISGKTKFMAVVKAFAYGSDSVQIGQKLEKLGVDALAVAYVSEGIALRKNGVKLPILVLHPQMGHFSEIINYELMPSLYSQLILNGFIKEAEKYCKKDYPVHLKLNTGLNRLGFEGNEINALLNSLKNTKAIKVEGVFSHLAASEDASEKAFSLQQMEEFQSFTSQLIKNLNYRPLLHLCNTSGILNYPQAHFDMVRSGIALYGFGNSAKEDANLIPVASLKTLISQIHEVLVGSSVGYNRGFIAKRPTRIATLPLGHADGINRIYGKGKGIVSVNGNPAPIVGNVCMDMIMIDVSGIDCQEGDEVLIFGKNKSAEEFANRAGTISYELITSISQRVKRKILD